MANYNNNSKYATNSMMVPFSCGHDARIYYTGKSMRIKKMAEAEKKLCPLCKKKEQKKKNKHTRIPYSYYRDHLKRARNVFVGEYDPKTKEIEVWIPWQKYEEYMSISQRIYYEPHNTPVQNNGSVFTILIKGERSKEIKDSLKSLGAKWKNWDTDTKYWCWGFIIEVKLEIDELHNFYIPYEINPQYYQLKEQLEKLGCIPDYSKLEW